MPRTVDGGHAIECTTVEAAREPNLHGRETIRRMTETIESTLRTERESGKHTMTSDQMRRAAHSKAKRLVEEKVAEHNRTPLR